ncbi:MAG: carbon monoxide dehydrogenase [Desulfobacteraceae bacterium]|nr:carbon monoxide dehydrogenase [Desulfobacteraceae bacterium]
MAKETSITKQVPASERTTCEATQQMLEKARKDGVVIALDRATDMKPCPIGVESACCKHCYMGPCRLNPRDPYKKVGICGATIDTIMARNLGRNVATGASSHNDHGMHILKLFRGIVEKKITDFSIDDTLKLEKLADSLGIDTQDREVYDVAKDLCDELEKTFSNVDGEMPFTRLAPEATLAQWRKDGIVPRGAMKEIMEMMSRTHIGCDQDYTSLMKQISRTALADGWGGSMVATELSDIMFGTPSPVVAEVNMGVLKEDHVNVIVHGHEPAMFEGMLAAVNDPFYTHLITTSDRAHIEGATHIEFAETDPRACTDQVLTKAISRFGSRSMPIQIPNQIQKGVQGFTHEYIEYMLGGTFRGSYSPLNENIINGRIRGVAGVVGCTNPKVQQDYIHVELVKELIRNDVLVLQTGCSQIALSKAGFLTPEAGALAGPGLAEVCETVGMPPVLGLGSCVDNTRILIAASAMVKAGGLGNSIADLPVAGCAPEWMSEKALAIGQYFVETHDRPH